MECDTTVHILQENNQLVGCVVKVSNGILIVRTSLQIFTASETSLVDNIFIGEMEIVVCFRIVCTNA